MFFQDVVDRVACPECHAPKGERCHWDELTKPVDEGLVFSHAARYRAHRDAISDEELAALGRDMLGKYKSMEGWREMLK